MGQPIGMLSAFVPSIIMSNEIGFKKYLSWIIEVDWFHELKWVHLHWIYDSQICSSYFNILNLLINHLIRNEIGIFSWKVTFWIIVDCFHELQWVHFHWFKLFLFNILNLLIDHLIHMTLGYILEKSLLL